ncbi:hypothetical protein JYT28_00525 [Desulfobulbus sp. AH-315-M07]|nr:hypothetical protein [Desulfobulbus sp. AH-315-M07]
MDGSILDEQSLSQWLLELQAGEPANDTSANRDALAHRIAKGQVTLDEYDAVIMRDVLARSLTAVRDPALSDAQLLGHAACLEAMAYFDESLWFTEKRGLAWAADAYFEVADGLMERFEKTRATSMDAEDSARLLTSAMNLLIQRLIRVPLTELVAGDIAPEVLACGRGAAERFVKWCTKDVPDRHRMLIIVAYALVGVTNEAVMRRLQGHRTYDLPLVVREAQPSLDVALQVIELMMSEYPDAELWFDEGQYTHASGQPSRLVRALQGITWTYDRLGEVGLAIEGRFIARVVERLRALWPSTFNSRQEAVGVVAALVSATSAWSLALEQGLVQDRSVALEALWLARQSATAHAGDYMMGCQLLQLVQMTAAVAGIAARRGLTKDLRLGELSIDLVSRVNTDLGNPTELTDVLVPALYNLAALAGVCADNGIGDPVPLLRSLVEVVDRTPIPPSNASTFHKRSRRTGPPQDAPPSGAPRPPGDPPFTTLCEVLGEAARATGHAAASRPEGPPLLIACFEQIERIHTTRGKQPATTVAAIRAIVNIAAALSDAATAGVLEDAEPLGRVALCIDEIWSLEDQRGETTQHIDVAVANLYQALAVCKGRGILLPTGTMQRLERIDGELKRTLAPTA